MGQEEQAEADQAYPQYQSAAGLALQVGFVGGGHHRTPELRPAPAWPPKIGYRPGRVRRVSRKRKGTLMEVGGWDSMSRFSTYGARGLQGGRDR
jgi:hypothetical protein